MQIILHTFKGSIKLLPFLFITYLIMEFIEHKTGNKASNAIKKSGKYGPLIGGLLGIFPQCGFSVSATNLYSGRLITLGTLIAVYLSTSDEMLPIFISKSVSPIIILKILGIKFIIGTLVGFSIDCIIRLRNRKQNKQIEIRIVDICENEHCNCKESTIFKSALKHTVNIFLYIVLIMFIMNTLIYIIGEEKISSLLLDKKFLGPLIAGLIGLIPNCASSVILTNMYLENVISVSSMIAGLLVGSGIGLIVLFRTNRNIKENLKIVGLLYTVSVCSGILLDLFGIMI